MAAIDKDLLAILICPESHQPLAEASADVLARVNERIAKGGVKNQGGATLSVKLEAGLVRADKQRLYPIQDGIPLLLVDEGIAL
ncbi:MAG: hypothetical protein HZA53_14040 [Planctomycetes bacterium]|nr:hypothetical protein [Planctomycetota bacterium]